MKEILIKRNLPSTSRFISVRRLFEMYLSFMSFLLLAATFMQLETVSSYRLLTVKLKHRLKKLEYNIAYTTNNTLQRHLTNKTKHEKHTSTGVYKLKCNKCPKFYIGQTGRSFKTRYTEHVKTLTQPLIKTNFAGLIFNTHHCTYTNIKTNLEILNIATTKRL